MPPTPWLSRYATHIPHKRFCCRRNPALEVQLIPLRSMAWAVLPFIFLPGGAPARAQAGTTAQIRFTYENPKLQPHKYVLTVGEDGTGHFRSQAGPAISDGQGVAAESPVESLDRPIHISKAVRESMFASARKNKLFAIACDDGGKNIAFQGTKTLAYEGPEGQGSCTYNWSKLSQIEKLTDQFEAIATTLDEGSKLQRQYEHGRLSLDTELELLDQMVREGRAIEVENIAPLLRTIAGDDAVLHRVQRRARALLQAAKED